MPVVLDQSQTSITQTEPVLEYQKWTLDLTFLNDRLTAFVFSPSGEVNCLLTSSKTAYLCVLIPTSQQELGSSALAWNIN